MLEVGKKYRCEIVDIGDGGVGIGKYEGFTVFVNGVLLGEIVDVKITKSKKNYAQGVVSKLIKESEYRVDRICDVKYSNCGGCQIQELDYKKQLEIKTNKIREDLQRIGGFENIEVFDTIDMEYPFRYRNKAQFPVQKIGENIKIGPYKKRTHEVVDIDKCVIQSEKNDQIIKIIRSYLEKNNISIYDEKTHRGNLRHIITKVGYKTDDVMVVLVCRNEELENIDELVKTLEENIKGFKTLVVNINKERTNVIMGQKNKIIYGDGKISDYIGDILFEISSKSFFQVNPIQTEVLYNKALEYADISEEDTVFDIYCGIGTISLFLAQKAKKVYGVEIVEEAIKDAKRNSEINEIKNAEFFVGKAEEVVPKIYKEGKKADIVVIDPPRKGCEEVVLDTIVKMYPKRVVYVSCNTATLARDLKYLAKNGYMVDKIQGVDMFAHSFHVETVASLQRVD